MLLFIYLFIYLFVYLYTFLVSGNKLFWCTSTSLKQCDFWWHTLVTQKKLSHKIPFFQHFFFSLFLFILIQMALISINYNKLAWLIRFQNFSFFGFVNFHTLMEPFHDISIWNISFTFHFSFSTFIACLDKDYLLFFTSCQTYLLQPYCIVG